MFWIQICKFHIRHLLVHLNSSESHRCNKTISQVLRDFDSDERIFFPEEGEIRSVNSSGTCNNHYEKKSGNLLSWYFIERVCVCGGRERRGSVCVCVNSDSHLHTTRVKQQVKRCV